ncbi:hypothetical protein D3C76_1516060 [compost metagenome]
MLVTLQLTNHFTQRSAVENQLAALPRGQARGIDVLLCEQRLTGLMLQALVGLHQHRLMGTTELHLTAADHQRQRVTFTTHAENSVTGL